MTTPPDTGPRFPRKRLLAIVRACTGKATEQEWAMVYKSAASMVWPSVIGEAIAAFRASRAECAALRSSLEEARKDSARLDWLEQSIAPSESAERGRCVSLCGQPPAGRRPKTSWHVHLNGIGPTSWAESARDSLDAAMAEYPIRAASHSPSDER